MNQTAPFINPDEALPTVENMLYSLAWKCANTYPVTFEEARSEAQYAFMRACYDYNPTKSKGAKFSSWCYFWVWTHLKTIITKRTTDPLVLTEMNEELTGEAPPQRSESLEMVEGFSTEAKEIISLLIETPSELLGGAAITPRQLLSKVKAYLVRKGWEVSRFDRAQKEITEQFQTAWAL